MIKQLVMISFCALTMVGCASSGDGRNNSSVQVMVNDDGEVTHICRREKPVGSNMSQRVCRRVDDIERERELAQEEINAIRGGSTVVR